jgi:hypothetical protein
VSFAELSDFPKKILGLNFYYYLFGGYFGSDFFAVFDIEVPSPGGSG